MLIFAIMYAVLGLKTLVEPASDDGRFILYALMPEPLRVALWLLPAGLAVLTLALRHRWRSDALAFSALVVPAVVMAFSYLWSVVAFMLGATTWAFGWSSAASWLLILALLFIMSGWEEVRSVDADPKGGAHSA